MDTGDVVASTIATVSLIATAILTYRQTRLQARLTVIEQTRQRQEGEAHQHADVRAMQRRCPRRSRRLLGQVPGHQELFQVTRARAAWPLRLGGKKSRALTRLAVNSHR